MKNFIIIMVMISTIMGTSAQENLSVDINKIKLNHVIDKKYDKRKQLIINIYNDLFAPDNEDRHLTNSIEVGYISDKLPKFLEWYESSSADEYYSATLSQEIYTPQDIEDFELIEDDRPYAGWSYLRFSVAKKENGDIEITTLDFGMIGEYSLAEHVQIEYHKLIDARDPNGWEHQLENELGVNFSHYRARNFRVDYEVLSADITPFIGGSIGNVNTSVSSGFVARFGHNLPKNSLIPYNLTKGTELTLYASASIVGSRVYRDIFLDGNTFEDSHRVAKEPYVGRASFGVTLGYANFELAYTYRITSKQFIKQYSHDQGGTISLRYSQQF